MENREVTLSEVLDFRERKTRIQKQMQSRLRDAAVVSLGMNIPGPVKSGPSVRMAFCEGQRLAEQVISQAEGIILEKEVLEGKAGYAAVYLIKNMNEKDIKRRMVLLEETHKIGRLWDIDVAGRDGTAITRQMVGAEGRKCFLCGRDAKVCGRSRSHSVPELQQKVRELLREWKGDRQ